MTSALQPRRAPLLAIDTSTERMALAVCSARGLSTADEPGGALASTHLLPRVHTLLAQAGLALADLQGIAFGCGPGAFTGLRTSCAVAQGLAFGLSLPLVAVDSLLIVAEAARQALGTELPATVTVAMDARMDEVYAGAYAWDGTRWHTTQPPALWTLPALCAAWQAAPPAAVAGSALAAFGARLPLHAATVQCAGDEHRAEALMQVAQQAWADGLRLDPADALPLYLRDKVALTTLERAARKVVQ